MGINYINMKYLEVFIINNTFKKYYILGIILLIFIIAVLIFQYSYLNNSIKANKEINIEKSIEILGQEITIGLKAYSQIILSSTELIATDMWTQKELEVYFKKLMNEDGGFASIYFGDINNKLINSVDWIPPEDYDLRTRTWYKKAVEEEEMIYSEAYVDALTKRDIVTISKPVYDDNNNELMGVVSGDIFLENIIKFVKEVKAGTIGQSFLIDGEGYVIGHPKYEHGNYSELTKIDEISDLVLNEMKAKITGRKEIVFDDVHGYLFYQPVANTDWIVGNFISLVEYNKNDYPLWNMFIMILMSGIIIFGGFVFIQNKYILKPLRLLERDIEEIDVENKINYRLPIKEGDPFINPRSYINIVLNETEKSFNKKKDYHEELLASHEELEASYGQLSAMEQELREQYTELERRETELYKLSHYDQLTGLANRRFFEFEFTRLDSEENFPLALIMADVNGLKLINDSFGHEAGDELLKIIARSMNEICGDKQFVSRIGGDEFIILLPKTGVREAQNVINRIRKLLSKKNLYNMEISVSFGIAVKSFKYENITNVLKQAEDNMYSNKLVEGPSMRSRTIDTIIQALYENNPREQAHSHRVSELCKQMGVHLGMTEEEVRQLEKVGLLHDIGKVAISDTILEKPGALTKEEFKEIKKHPEIGYRILSTINEMSQMSEYVLAHHERCDGTGYPKGLKSEEIPLVSKIIAIADAYDAMISDRPYRKGMDEDLAIKEIIKNSGTQFDLELSNIFVEKVLKKEWISY